VKGQKPTDIAIIVTIRNRSFRFIVPTDAFTAQVDSESRLGVVNPSGLRVALRKCSPKTHISESNACVF
jgi:hypothetical protein